jgi:metal-dependent amidase/aminoacylase/carboxypeptidase family protein
MIKKIAEDVAQGYGCTVDSTYFFGPAPLINEHKVLNDLARGAVIKIMGKEALVPMVKQMGAEDFSVYMESTPGVFGFLGAQNKAKGICCVHHHPAFDVDEDVLPLGAGVYAQFAIDYLAKK